MLNLHARDAVSRIMDPVGRALARRGVSPDVITGIGTLGVSAGALIFYPRGQFFVGTVVITLFVFNDMIDGALGETSARRQADMPGADDDRGDLFDGRVPLVKRLQP